MNKWDGQTFIDELALSGTEKVLEIGVGTGRLAVRTAPLCKELVGIDCSELTIERAESNLSVYNNVSLICDDFLKHDFDDIFDVVYSSLTFMHFENKQAAISKISELLRKNGKMVLSIDKNQAEIIDMGSRKLKVYPDTPENITECIAATQLKTNNVIETDHAFIITASNLI